MSNLINQDILTVWSVLAAEIHEEGPTLSPTDQNVSQLFHTWFKQHYGKIYKNITILDLSKRNLNHVPTLVFKIPRLKELNLEYNHLTKIPKEIKSLKKLEDLNVQKNNLQSLPKEVGDLVNLKYLLVGENYLETIPFDFSKFKNFQIFDAAGNPDLTLQPEILNHKSFQENLVDE